MLIIEFILNCVFILAKDSIEESVHDLVSVDEVDDGINGEN